MAQKKKGLPFVVQPRLEPVLVQIGTEESGIIEIERKGYLTVAEKSIVQGGMRDSDSMSTAMGKIKALSIELNVPVGTIFEDLGKGDIPEYLAGHEVELMEIMSLMQEHEDRLRVISATALLITRIDPEWEAADTMDLHPDLQEALYQLYSKEEQRSMEVIADATGDMGREQEETKAGKE